MEYPRIAPMMNPLMSPLAAMTASWEGRDNAMLASGIVGASIVPESPRVLVLVGKEHLTHRLIEGSGCFALCFLRRDQLALARTLGFVSGHAREKLAGVAVERRTTGAPVLSDCFGFLDCRVVNAMDTGDQTALLADVVDGDVLLPGEPLTWPGMRTFMPKEWMTEFRAMFEGELAYSRRAMGEVRRQGWPLVR